VRKTYVQGKRFV